MCRLLTRHFLHERTRALLDDLLMTALDGAFTLSKMNYIALAIAKDLFRSGRGL